MAQKKSRAAIIHKRGLPLKHVVADIEDFDKVVDGKIVEKQGISSSPPEGENKKITNIWWDNEKGEIVIITED